jgi:multisubunit Na+/H+ antiporter MnhB subunit
MTNKPGSPLWKRPATRLGWWAVGLAAASIVLSFAWSILPGGALVAFTCGLAGGVLALIAMIRQRERSWLVFLSLLPMLFVLSFILGEFLNPH